MYEQVRFVTSSCIRQYSQIKKGVIRGGEVRKNINLAKKFDHGFIRLETLGR
jgi:hypothetical protein